MEGKVSIGVRFLLRYMFISPVFGYKAITRTLFSHMNFVRSVNVPGNTSER
jgi:hypothetical protein